MTTEERLAAVEAKLAKFEALTERLMALAAQHPVGRQLIKRLVKDDA